jgi:glycosyltransferase involved in cell wall biosynthesis
VNPDNPTVSTKKFLLVLCLERFWPAHGGVEAYAQDIARWFQGSCSVMVVTAVRQDRSLREELLDSDGSYLESDVGGARVRVLTAGLRAPARRWFRSITKMESLSHRLFESQYYRTRWIVAKETGRLLARDLERLLEVDAKNVVVHAMGPWELSLVGDRLFPRAAHVATPFIHPGHWGEDPFSRRWFRSRDALVALSEEDARVCRETARSPERVQIVPIFGPPRIESTARREERRSVVFLGIARPYKGVEVFIEAARLLRLENPDLDFIWAGSIPSESEPLVHVASAAGVKILGSVGEDAKREILSRALCLCLPSTTEITPYSFLEAWAAGCPVVTTDTPHLREFVGEGGELVPREPAAFASAVRRLAASPELTEYRANEGRMYLARRHHSSLVGPALEKVYQKAMEQKQALSTRIQ